MAILQHTAQEIAVLASSADQAPARSRRQDVRRLRLSATRCRRSRSVIKADGGKGDVQDRDPRHRGVRGAVREAGRLRDHVHRLGGRRGRSSAGSTLRYFQFARLRLPGLLPGRPRLRPPTGWRATRTRPRRSSARRSAASSSRPTNPTRPPRSSSPRTRACSTPTRSCRRRSQQFLAEGGYLVDDAGDGRTQTLDAWRATRGSCTTRACWPTRDGKPLTAAPDYARAVHERLPAVSRR